MWSDKYQPENIKDVIGYSRPKHEISYFLNQFIQSEKGFGKKKPKALLLIGPPGCGKQMMAHLAAKQNKFFTFEFNATDLTTKESVKKLFDLYKSNVSGLYFSDESMFEHEEETFQTKPLIILHGIDAISKGDSGLYTPLVAALRKSNALPFHGIHPIIMTTCDLLGKRIKTLKNWVQQIYLKPLGIAEMYNIVHRIFAFENVSIPDEKLLPVLEKAKGDVRGVLNNIQFALIKKPTKNEHVYDWFAEEQSKSLAKKTNIRQSGNTPDYLLRALLLHPEYSMEEKMYIASQEPFLLPILLFHVTPTLIKEPNALEIQADVSEHISHGDYMYQSAIKLVFFALLDNQPIFSTIIPLQFLQKNCRRNFILDIKNYCKSFSINNTIKAGFKNILAIKRIHPTFFKMTTIEIKAFKNKLMRFILYEPIEDLADLMIKYNITMNNIELFLKLKSFKDSPEAIRDLIVQKKWTTEFKKELRILVEDKIEEIRPSGLKTKEDYEKNADVINFFGYNK